MNKTVASVNPEPRMWESKYGPMASLTVVFDDGTKGNLNCKPDKVGERVATFNGLVGQQVTVEDAGKFDDGNPKPFKITDYPGKPEAQQKGSGGRSGFVPDPTRYATEAAVSLAQTAWRLPDGNESRGRDGAQGAADSMLAFVEKAAPRILKAITGAAVDSAPSPAANRQAAAPGGGEDGKAGAPPPSGNGGYRLKPENCPHTNVEDAPRAGFKQCPTCGKGGPARWFEKQDQLA